MRRVVAFMLFLVTGLTGTLVLSPLAQAADTGQTAPQTGRIVSEEPAKAVLGTPTTPHVLDGTVYSITQVGSQIVVGGSFTSVENPGTSTPIARNHVFSFDANTGRVSTTFNPAPNGTVYKVQAAADGTSVYIGGLFSSAFGATAKNLVRANVSTGAKITAFTPSNLDGVVRDLEVVGNRLWVAGKFTHIGGRAQKALGTLNATTGLYDPYFTGVFAGVHNTSITTATTNVLQISTNRSNTELMAVGNFMTVDGQSRVQIVKIDISGATSYALSGWSTTLFVSACSPKFETNMTDVEYSPNGSFFVVSTTGAWGGVASNTGTSGCDVVARFESGTSGPSTATWTAYTGGDTTWTVEVTDDVVYAGGHQRWQNNPGAGDVAGQGAVERTGIAALNTVNGMPFSWNPTRARGVGVQDMLANNQGLYVGSDTTLLGKTAGNTFHARLALLPLSTGKTLPVIKPYTLPADVYTVPLAGSQLARRSFDGTTATAPVNAPNGPGWSTSVGAFMVNGTLYTATSTGTTNGVLTKQTFNGTTYGPATTVDTADALVRQAGWHDTDIPKLTSLFYSNGRIYFTLSGTNALFYRGFEVEDDVVGQQRFSTAGTTTFNYTGMRGAFVANGKFYFSNATGQLFSANWGGNAPTGTPVQVSGAGSNWASRAMFVAQGTTTTSPPPPPPGNSAPTADVAQSCTNLSCRFDASGSTDSDGTIASYLWDFGDQTATATGAVVTHAFAKAGQYTVTLTVTDNGGLTDTATATVNVTAPPTTGAISFVDAASTSGNRQKHTVTIPSTVQAGDALVLLFTANSTTPTYPAPAGWDEVQAPASTGIALHAYSKVASATDAGAPVTVSSGTSTVKSSIAVSAYRGTSGSPVVASASKIDATAGAAHTSPAVTATGSANWLVSYWADKSGTNDANGTLVPGSATTAWTTPDSEARRTTSIGSGAGEISAALTDSGGPVSAGPAGNLTATANATSNKGASVSILLQTP